MYIITCLLYIQIYTYNCNNWDVAVRCDHCTKKNAFQNVSLVSASCLESRQTNPCTREESRLSFLEFPFQHDHFRYFSECSFIGPVLNRLSLHLLICVPILKSWIKPLSVCSPKSDQTQRSYDSQWTLLRHSRYIVIIGEKSL